MAARREMMMASGMRYQGSGYGYPVPILPTFHSLARSAISCILQLGPTHPPHIHKALAPCTCATCSLTVFGDKMTVF